jgi:hypothetical protein
MLHARTLYVFSLQTVLGAFTTILLREESRMHGSSFCNNFHLTVTFSLLCTNTLLVTLCWNTALVFVNPVVTISLLDSYESSWGDNILRASCECPRPCSHKIKTVQTNCRTFPENWSRINNSDLESRWTHRFFVSLDCWTVELSTYRRRLQGVYWYYNQISFQGYQEKPSFATTVQGVYCILYLDRYMFRPLLAIIRRNTQYNM